MQMLKGVDNDCPEEDKEKYQAALCIASLKHVKLSRETAMALHALKTKILSQIRARRNKRKAPKKSNNPTQESVSAQNFPGNLELCVPALSSYFPTDTPPVAKLDGVIGKCSKAFEKQLTRSDVNDSQCRLSINKFDVENAVMPLLKEEEDSAEGIPVTIYDADGKEYRMKFITWASKFHVLKEGWIDFCNDHSLLPYQDFVTLWVFRKRQTGNLCVAITSRRLEVFEAIKRRRLNYN